MAQTVTNGIATTPFPMPPGLDTANGTGAAVTAATTTTALSSSDAGAFSATQEADTPEQQAIITEVRKTVLEEVDAKVAEKMKDLWAKGNRMIKKAEEDSQQKNATILAELQQCLQKQELLRAENEQLKTLITNMAQQLNMLGGYFGGLAGPKISSPTPSSLAALSGAPVTNSATSGGDASSATASSTIQDSPQTDFSAAMSAGSFPPLPSVPDFPFPQTPQQTPQQAPLAATPLSLAEALSSETPSSSVPVSLMGSLPPPCQGQRIFSFTLRKADGSDLGLNVSHHEEDKALRVEGVRPEGAVEAWNRQCVGSTASEKAVLAGDRIVSVNGVSNDPAKMLEECRDKQLLKLTVIRGEAVPAPKTPVLRADAPEFVPPGGSTSAGLDAISEQPEQPAQEETARRVWKDDEDKAENPTES